MSVVILGMKMPETCDECPLHHYHSAGKYVCEATPMFYPWNLANTKGIRKEWCPLVELPEQHGRLIDSSAIGLTDFEIVMCDGNYKEALTMLLKKIERAPTVIEAEEVSE